MSQADEFKTQKTDLAKILLILGTSIMGRLGDSHIVAFYEIVLLF